MPTNIFSSNTTDLTLDLSIKSSTKRTMSAITSDPGGGNSTTENDEIKIFECEKHEDDNNDRLSPVIKEEESSPQTQTDRPNSEQQFHSFFPYFISPYYQTTNAIQSFDKMPSLESLSKFMFPSSAHISNSDQNTGIPNPIYPLSSPNSFQSPYSQPWCSPMFPFVFPPGYSFSPNSNSKGLTNNVDNNNSQREYKQRISHDNHKQKQSHIKKPLNAFMLFMKEQRSQVIQECTLRESAAINQILGRKWHELDRNVQQKYYDMARNERMKHMQLYPGWSARDNYGVKKKRTNKGRKQDKNQECLNQKKCRARFGLEQQANWCKHCKRKKKCLRYTENETISVGVASWTDEDDIDTDNVDDSDDCDVISMIEHKDLMIHTGISMDSDEENKSRLLKYQQISNLNQPISMTMKSPNKDSPSFHHYSFLPTTSMPILDQFKPEI